MSFVSQSQKILYLGLILVAFVVVAGPARAQLPELEVTISDTTVTAGDSAAWISVFVRNYQDILSGFAMRIVLNRPDIMEFPTDVEDTVIDTIYWECQLWNDNVCLDSQALNPPEIDTFYVNRGVDTVGCLTNYWSIFNATSWSPTRHDIRVIGIADEQGDPYTPGLKPRTTQALLYRINVRLYDSLPEDKDSLVVLRLEPDLSQTNFSDQVGNSIGTITRYNICDTAYCESWDYTGDSCLTELQDSIPEIYDTMLVDTFFRWHFCGEWGQNSQGGDSCLLWYTYSDPDSIPEILGDTLDADYKDIDSVAWTVWNEQTTTLDNGELRVVQVSCLCGDINNDATINIGDPVYLIDFIFRGGPAPIHTDCADVNNDGGLNIGDAVYMITYIFKGGSAPFCGF